MIAFPVRLSIYKRSPPYLALLYTQEVTTISCFVVYTREGLHSSQGQSFCSSSGKGTLSCLQLNTILQLQKILLVCGWPKAYVLALNSIGAVLPEEYNYRYLALWTFGTQIIQFFSCSLCNETLTAFRFTVLFSQLADQLKLASNPKNIIIISWCMTSFFVCCWYHMSISHTV